MIGLRDCLAAVLLLASVPLLLAVGQYYGESKHTRANTSRQQSVGFIFALILMGVAFALLCTQYP